MLLNDLIPTAFADNAGAAAKAAVATQAGTAGITGLFGFLADHIFFWIGGVVILFIFYILGNSAASRAKEHIIKSKGEDVQENVLVLVERLTKIAVMTIGFIIAASINGINVATIVGAVSLGIGIALKDIIGNFISSIVMLAQNQIRIGDLINVGGIIGTITNITMRVTVLQAMDGTEIVVPNQTMLNTTLISYTTNPYRRIDLIVGVDYKTNLEQATSLIKAVLDRHPDVVVKPPASVLVNEFAASSVNIQVFFWLESGKPWMQIRSNVAYRIKEALDKAGISIPCPIRVLRIDEDDRALLKTMDSLKKGLVPDEKPPLTKAELQQAAQTVAADDKIPHELFEKPKPVDLPPGTPIPNPAQVDALIPPAPNPADMPKNSGLFEAPPSHL